MFLINSRGGGWLRENDRWLLFFLQQPVGDAQDFVCGRWTCQSFSMFCCCQKKKIWGTEQVKGGGERFKEKLRLFQDEVESGPRMGLGLENAAAKLGIREDSLL